MTDELEFRDPPAERRRGRPSERVQAIIDKLLRLQEHPERWAVIARYEGTEAEVRAANYIQQMISGTGHKGGWEAIQGFLYESVTRNETDEDGLRRVEVFARYLGERQ